MVVEPIQNEKDFVNGIQTVLFQGENLEFFSTFASKIYSKFEISMKHSSTKKFNEKPDEWFSHILNSHTYFE